MANKTMKPAPKPAAKRRAPARPEGVSKTFIPGHNRPVIVRSRDAGCLYGKLVGYDGTTVYLVGAKQMWSWTAAKGVTLIDCAIYGVKGGKYSAPGTVTVFSACAIIGVTVTAQPSLEAA